MSKKEKLIARLLTFPKDFIYDEMRTLYTILLHKPHPNNQLKPYQVRQIVQELKTLKLI